MPLLFDRVSETADAGVPPAAPRFGVGRGNVRRAMRLMGMGVRFPSYMAGLVLVTDDLFTNPTIIH